MSSFSNPHYMYLFEMTNGKQKLAYGQSPEDALEILGPHPESYLRRA